MPTYSTKRHVLHSADEMFELVADVESYPQFLPLCEALKVTERRHKGSVTMLVAQMTVGYKQFRETFTSRVILKPDENIIEVSYVDGPFKYLENRWQFIDLPEGECDVDFFIDYQFKNKILGALMGTMFDRAFRSFAEAFENRANQIYA